MSKRQRVCAAAGLALGISAWCFCYSVSIPDWKAHQPASLTSTAARSDLYPRWLGARELLLHHRNPYSEGVTRQIQSGYYGRPLAGAYVADPQLFSYPLYVVFLLAPAIGVDFPVVRFAVSLLLLVATAASVRWWFSAFPQLRSSANLLPLALIFTLGSWPVVQGISVQQLTLLVAALLAAATAAVARRQFWLAGALLAVATIKPQLSIPYAAWLMVWGAAGWKTRRALLWGFLLSMTILVSTTEAILPGWIAAWRSSWSPYLQGTGSTPSLVRMFGQFWGYTAMVAIAAAVVGVCLSRVREEPASPRLAACHALVLAATLIILPTWSLAGYNQVLLAPAVFCLVAARPVSHGRSAALLRVVAIASVLWPGVAAAGLELLAALDGAAALSHRIIQRLPSGDYLFMPLLVSASLALAYRSVESKAVRAVHR